MARSAFDKASRDWVAAAATRRAEEVRLRALKVKEIKRVVSEFYDLGLNDLASRARPEPLATIRQLAMVLCRELAGATLVEVAEAFNRTDHCTVGHAQNAIADKRTTDVALQNHYNHLTKKCRLALAEIK